MLVRTPKDIWNSPVLFDLNYRVAGPRVSIRNLVLQVQQQKASVHLAEDSAFTALIGLTDGHFSCCITFGQLSPLFLLIAALSADEASRGPLPHDRTDTPKRQSPYRQLRPDQIRRILSRHHAHAHHGREVGRARARGRNSAAHSR